MAYAIAQDWLEAEESQSFIGDTDGDGAADVSGIDKALVSASAEMDGWLASRYPVPVIDPAAIPVLRVHAVAIATYHLARTANEVTEDIKERYKASIDYLKSVAKGVADLPVTKQGTGQDENGPAAATTSDVQMIAPERQFSRSEFSEW
jgi:phage gp36-like protein